MPDDPEPGLVDGASRPYIRLVVNERPVSLQVDETKPLLAVLREDLELRATRYGCGMELCGACMVLIDGEPAYSCSREVGTCEGRWVTTLEGLQVDGKPHPLQEALISEQAGQCCYCLSGIQISAYALLRRNRSPTRAEIAAALDPHLCRCGIHNRVIRAVQKAAATLSAGR